VNTDSIPESFFQQPGIREQFERDQAKAHFAQGMENITRARAKFALNRLDTRDREAIYCELQINDNEFGNLRHLLDRDFSEDKSDKIIRETYEFVAKNLPTLDGAKLRQTIEQILVLSYVKLKCTNAISELTKALGDGRPSTVAEIPKFIERNFVRWLLERGSNAPPS
jgi:hypothetical protein